VFNTLIEGKILVDDNFDDLQELDNAVRNYNLTGDSSAIGLTIAPTLSCNFRCIYCYEESAGHQPIFMSKETADNVIRFIRHQLRGPRPTVSIEWYGGEPLMAIDTVYYISQELKKVLGDRMSNSIVTNWFSSY